MSHDQRRSPSDHLQPPTLPAEETVRGVIDPNERIIWAGRPDLEALTAEARRRSGAAGLVKSLLRPLAVLLVFIGGWAYMNGLDLPGLLAMLEIMASARPLQMVLIPLVFLGFIGLIYGLHAVSARKFIQRARSLTYAITDRRLLVMVGTEIEEALGPDEVRNIDLRVRSEGFRDVIFLRRSGQGSGKGESLLARERRLVGFKALPDAKDIAELVERWRDAHLTSAERSLADFLEEEGVVTSRSDGGDLTAAADERSLDGQDDPSGVPLHARGAFDDGGRTLRGGRYGLVVTFPEEWDAQVRQRRKPYGTVFLDTLSWQSPEEAADWNVVRVDGPFQTTVEIHVDAVTEPMTSFEKAVGSTLGRWVTGEVVDSDPDVRRGRFQGWSVTRRHEAGAKGDDGDELDRPGFHRVTQLYDGAAQVTMVSHWPGGSEALARAVDRIEAGVSVDRLDGHGSTVMAGVEPGSGLSTALGCAGGLLATVRVLIGIVVLGLGVWAGYDQATRAAAYRDATGRLQEAQETGLPTLPADQVVDSYDGRLAYLQGDLRAPTVTDSLTGLTVESWRLVRAVEPGPDPASPPALPDASIIADGLQLGAWRLSPYAYGSGDEVAVPAEVLARADLEEPWQVSDGLVVHGGRPDVRIRYRYHAITSGPRSVIGVPDDGVLDLADELGRAPLMVDGSVPPEEMVQAAAATSRPVQSAWMMWAWVGLMILLRPLARPFVLFRAYTTAPFLRRQLLGGAVSAMVVLVLAFLFS